jgi:hypothetical protein
MLAWPVCALLALRYAFVALAHTKNIDKDRYFQTEETTTTTTTTKRQ